MSKFGKADNYYNQWHKDPNESIDNLEKINSRRITIGLESIDEFNIKINRAFKVNRKVKGLPLEFYFKLILV